MNEVLYFVPYLLILLGNLNHVQFKMSNFVTLAQLKKDATWREDSVLVFEAENVADVMVNLKVMFSGKNTCGREVRSTSGLFPHWPARLAFPLSVSSGKTLFLPRTPGRFKATIGGANVSFEDLEAVRIDIAEEAQAFVKITNLRIEAKMPDEYLFPEQLLVDHLHQWAPHDWAGKAQNMEEVKKELEAELEAPSSEYPETWSKYGGWKLKKFSATGFFRTEHDGQRWWLVDPEGCGFWSIGIDCVRYTNAANVEGITTVFEEALPSPQTHPHLWPKEHLFEAKIHNLERILGENWKEKWYALTRQRLVDYRFNTIANWSDTELQKRSKIPYVFTMVGYPQTSKMLFRDFPDVYADEFSQSCRDYAEQLKTQADNPYIIGYFMTNEPQWAFVEAFDLGDQLLREGGDSASLSAWILQLKGKYTSIEQLNVAWNANLKDFEDLRQPHVPERWGGRTVDTQAFTRSAVERYVRMPAQACHAVDPHHLNLGLRWAWIHSDYQLAGADILDAFSINCYQLKPDPDLISKLADKTGKPVVIGEFHIGSLDKGLPSGGIKNTLTMAESVEAYRYYVEHAATLPGLIGVHYFKWDDQHVMGRFDGENMQIGLHDITDRVYPEWKELTASLHPNLYEIIDGKRNPDSKEPKVVPQGTLVW